MTERANPAAFCSELRCLYMWRKGKAHSLFSLLIPPLYKKYSESDMIFALLCSTLFSAFIKNKKTTFFLPSLSNHRHRGVVAFDFHRTLSGWPEGPCVTYLYYARSLATVALRIVICWFPRQPTRTCVQGGLTDVEWKKPWLLSQNARTLY